MVNHITDEFDTIAAISTPAGEGALHIVRMSGDDALNIIDKVYRQGTKKISEQPSHTINYGHIVDPQNNQVLDEVMVSVMRAPKTYTREDVVEINCHGGIVVVNQVLQLLLRQGARLAEPGEFTKRAFLNGRIDLSQAEAVIDIIKAKTNQSLAVATQQLEGRLSAQIREIRQIIFDTLGEVEVNIDYPEYDDVEEVTSHKIEECALAVKAKIEHLLATAQQGKILRDGLSTAIIGKPNVGKSSLLNELLQEDKAIVTDIEGTTRDVIEEYVNVSGVPLKLIDTAGIRETDDVVEKIGVEKSRQALASADLILLLLDQSEALTEDDIELLDATKGMNRFILLNKSDLPTKMDLDQVRSHLAEGEVVHPISVQRHEGIDLIGKLISQRYFNGQMGDRDATYISNVRHIALLEQAEQAMDDVLDAVHQGMPVDLIQIDLTRAWELLGEIIGESVQDELLNQLFSQFCLGK